MSVYSPLYACSLTHALIHASSQVLTTEMDSDTWNESKSSGMETFNADTLFSGIRIG